jgi:hypothetical protein
MDVDIIIRRGMWSADGERVWAWRPSSWQVLSLCLDEAQVTVTQKPVSPGRARRKPLTPLAQGMSMFRVRLARSAVSNHEARIDWNIDERPNFLNP